MSWIVITTRRDTEFLAKMHLEHQGYEVYLPLSVEPGQVEPKPFFPRYLFVDTSPNHGQWRPVRSTRYVTGVLMTGEAPSVMYEEGINRLKRREEAGVIRLRAREKIQAMQRGQVVRIHEGMFSGFDGIFERLAPDDRARIMISYLGRSFPIELPAEAVA